MREIKFRGWHVTDGWVYGYYVLDNDGNSLIYGIDPDDGSWGAWIVEPNSIGQYTGIEDNRGKPLWEGDIIKNKHGEKYVIVWDDVSCGFRAAADGDKKTNYTPNKYWFESCWKIGNIHENPELINERVSR
jgi:uncharacterized phage protein (TIGR01671 family)